MRLPRAYALDAVLADKLHLDVQLLTAIQDVANALVLLGTL